MKDTIKEDKERKIIKEEYLDNNTLLEISVEEGKVVISVRFVDTHLSGIKEHILLQIKAETYMKHMEGLIDISEKKDTIAIFKPTEKGYLLHSVYDTSSHEFVNADFTELLYKRRFPHKQLNKNLIKIDK